jgi:hypothetical protein
MHKKLLLGVSMLALTTVIGLGVFNNVNPEELLAQVSPSNNIEFRMTEMKQETCRCPVVTWTNDKVTKRDSRSTYKTAKLAQTTFLENLPEGAIDVTWYDQNKDGVADVIRYISVPNTIVLGINSFQIDNKKPVKLPFSLVDFQNLKPMTLNLPKIVPPVTQDNSTTNIAYRVTKMTTPTCQCANQDFNLAVKVEGTTNYNTSKLAQTAFLSNLPKGITKVAYYDQDKDGIADVLSYTSQGIVTLIGIDSFQLDTKKAKAVLPFSLVNFQSLKPMITNLPIILPVK